MRERILNLVTLSCLLLSLACGLAFIRELYRASFILDAIKHKRVSR